MNVIAKNFQTIIRNHPVTSFFIITYIITWGLWIPFAPMVYSGVRIDFFLPGTVFGIFGPAAAAIIIWAITNTEPQKPRSLLPYIVFVISWLLATLIHLARRADFDHLTYYVLTINALLGIPPAVVIALAFSRIGKLREGLSSLIRPRGSWYWYAAAAFIYPVIRVLGLIIAPIVGEDSSLADICIQNVEISSMLVFIAYKCMHNIIAEETGWRGFALPRLQERYGPFYATVLLAVLWIIWHIPLHAAQMGTDMEAVGPVYLDTLSGSFLLTWIYNKSRGSILAAGIMHVSFNFSYKFFPRTITWHVLLAMVAVATVIIWRFQGEIGEKNYRRVRD